MRDDRQIKILIGLGVAAAILLGKIFYIQIINSKYKADSISNSIVKEIIYPTRGVIYDRNGKIIVGNKVAYDIMVTPREVGKFDTLALAAVLDVDPQLIIDKMAEYKANIRRIGFQSVAMIKQVPAETYMSFDEVKYQFPGFYGQVRSIRDYPINAGGNLLGYVSEVDAAYIKAHPDEYSVGDYIGKTGIEAAREKDLRGEKGYHIYIRNAKGRIESSYKDGAEDKEASPGHDIMTTIDADLQRYGQQLMRNKAGAVVAIEPSTGEILAIVSSPGIDVNMLADIGKHYEEIANNPYKPMFNRAVQAYYPPGSCFKIVNALIGLQEGVLTPSETHPCNRGYQYSADKKLACHGHKSPINMEESIMMSCNAYYCYVLRNILDNRKYSSIEESMDMWNHYVVSFGFGKKLGSDFPSELGGNIPSARTYNKTYGKGRWNSHSVISLSIGQGEIAVTPLHLANFCATIANRGWYKIPHLVKEYEDIQIDPKYYEKHYTMVDTTQFPKVIRGMWRAVNSPPGTGGTAAIAHVDGLDICGKTGTAQNPRGEDNSVFMCFAPMDNPKIAVAAYVEYGGFGATFAAPIASLMVEKYLNGEIPWGDRKDLEARMKSSYLLNRVRIRRR
ncbi:MAG: penicillin-binding protein 2 [Bacteroidales bacterium]|nr:penicillin-binding protein 2 [Bacteroidales bacterium]